MNKVERRKFKNELWNDFHPRFNSGYKTQIMKIIDMTLDKLKDDQQKEKKGKDKI